MYGGWVSGYFQSGEVLVDYGQAIRFPFSGEKAWKNIALLAVCNLIPVIGPIVVMGYAAGVAKMLLRDLSASPPAFDFDRFTKYLERGVAPFVIQLIVSFAMLPVMWGIIIVGMLLIAASRGSVWGVVAGVSVLIMGIVAVVAVVGLAMAPLTLRAMLLGKIGKAFDLRWCVDFAKRVMGPALLSMIIVPLIAFPIALAGLLACYVGVFFVGGIITLFHTHVQVQLYQAYLDRGGIPLEIVDDPMPPAFPVVSPHQIGP